MENLQKMLKKYEIFEKGLNGLSESAFHSKRKDAFDVFRKAGYPTTRMEEWRFTNVSEIANLDLKLSSPEEIKSLNKEHLKPFLFKNWNGVLVVLVNGHFHKELSDLSKLDSAIKVSSLKNTLENKDIYAEELLTSIANYDNEVFTALNTAFTYDGVVIDVPANHQTSTPIHVLHIVNSNNSETMVYPRIFINVGKNSILKLSETYYTLRGKQCLTNTVTEIQIAENATMEHYLVQNENLDNYHIKNVSIDQKRDSRYYSINFAFGGKLVRNNINVCMDGAGIESTINGLYMAHKNQHIDNHTFLDHAMPHCDSHELYRGILQDNAKGVFSGKILVRKDAQKTDAKQSNNALLLSDESKVDSKPQLEIYADDVKCTHGATVGQLDEEALYYLRSRGIPEKKAISILTYAFAEEVIETITIPEVREKVDQFLAQRLEEDLDFIKE